MKKALIVIVFMLFVSVMAKANDCHDNQEIIRHPIESGVSIRK